MAKIRDIEVIPLVFTPPVPYGSARGLARTRGGSLILLHTEDGIEGIGEAWGPPAVTHACLEAIKPFYIGQSVFARLEHHLDRQRLLTFRQFLALINVEQRDTRDQISLGAAGRA